MMKTILLALALLVPVSFAQDDPVRELRIYDVGDLTGGLIGGKENSEVTQRRLAEIRRLLDTRLVQKSGGNLSATKRQLIVNASAGVHRGIERQLGAMRATLSTQYLIRARFLMIPNDAKRYPKLRPEKNGGIAGSFLTAKEAKALLAAVKEDPKAQLLHAPAILNNPFHNATMSIGNERKFVESYERIEGVEGYPDGLWMPKLKTVDEGLRFESFLIPHGIDSSHLSMELCLDATVVSSKPKVQQTEAGPIHKVVVRKRATATLLVLTDGSTAVLSGVHLPETLREGNEDKTGVVLVEVSRVK